MLPNNYSRLGLDLGNPNISVAGLLTVGNGLTVTGGSTNLGALSVTNLTATGALSVNSLTVTSTTTLATITTTGLTVTGALDLTSATTNNFVVKRYASTAITQANLIGGAATQVINLSSFPTNATPIGGYLVTSVATTSSNGGTTGLTASIGPASDPDGYVAVVSIFGAASVKETAVGGAMLGCMRLADTLQIALTATGGGPDIGHINQLSVVAVVYYVQLAALA